jgi:hypothetical protein
MKQKKPSYVGGFLLFRLDRGDRFDRLEEGELVVGL